MDLTYEAMATSEAASMDLTYEAMATSEAAALVFPAAKLLLMCHACMLLGNS